MRQLTISQDSEQPKPPPPKEGGKKHVGINKYTCALFPNSYSNSSPFYSSPVSPPSPAAKRRDRTRKGEKGGEKRVQVKPSNQSLVTCSEGGGGVSKRKDIHRRSVISIFHIFKHCVACTKFGAKKKNATILALFYLVESLYFAPLFPRELLLVSLPHLPPASNQENSSFVRRRRPRGSERRRRRRRTPLPSPPLMATNQPSNHPTCPNQADRATINFAPPPHFLPPPLSQWLRKRFLILLYFLEWG